jgi:hypothetical protein
MSKRLSEATIGTAAHAGFIVVGLLTSVLLTLTATDQPRLVASGAAVQLIRPR